MHPIEAASILSQLGYVAPSCAVDFADKYMLSVRNSDSENVPAFAPVAEYTPIFSEFAYASKLRLEPDTPNVYQEFGNMLSYNYYPQNVGKQSSYERTLFLMTRDAAVLGMLEGVKPMKKKVYCYENGDRIETELGLEELLTSLNYNGRTIQPSYNHDDVKVVYPCTNSYHDDLVPKCMCPDPPLSVELKALNKVINAHRAAAPFATRLADLYQKVGAAHSTAQNLEQSSFPTGTLLANFSFETWDDLGIDPADFPEGSLADLQLHRYEEHRGMLNMLALDARRAAEAAEADLAAFVAKHENAAFAAFMPHVRDKLTRFRANANDGYAVPINLLSIDDINPLYKNGAQPMYAGVAEPNQGIVIEQPEPGEAGDSSSVGAAAGVVRGRKVWADLGDDDEVAPVFKKNDLGDDDGPLVK